MPVYPGYPVPISMITPVPQLWWLRPASSAPRVGLQRAVVWKRVYLSPLSASFSMCGVGTGPPKVDAHPEPDVVEQHDQDVRAARGAFTGWG